MVSQQFVVIMLIFSRGEVNFMVIEADRTVRSASVDWKPGSFGGLLPAAVLHKLIVPVVKFVQQPPPQNPYIVSKQSQLNIM